MPLPTFYRIRDLEPDKFNTQLVTQEGRIQINHVANQKNQNTISRHHSVP